MVFELLWSNSENWQVEVLNNIFNQSTISTSPLIFSGGYSTYLAAYPIQVRNGATEVIPTSRVGTSSSDTSTASVGSTQTPSPTHHRALSAGGIAGVVIGAVFGIALVGLLVWILMILRRRHISDGSQSHAAPQNPTQEYAGTPGWTTAGLLLRTILRRLNFLQIDCHMNFGQSQIHR